MTSQIHYRPAKAPKTEVRAQSYLTVMRHLFLRSLPLIILVQTRASIRTPFTGDVICIESSQGPGNCNMIRRHASHRLSFLL